MKNRTLDRSKITFWHVLIIHSSLDPSSSVCYRYIKLKILEVSATIYLVTGTEDRCPRTSNCCYDRFSSVNFFFDAG